ncbi:MAG: hypothetical protein DRI57_25600 [Deltaproteobacteria bacterium]|nr:MAG: hypothetical protein DRI57_25600 [Deltaproteobacteria bacterium]
MDEGQFLRNGGPLPDRVCRCRTGFATPSAMFNISLPVAGRCRGRGFAVAGRGLQPRPAKISINYIFMTFVLCYG